MTNMCCPFQTVGPDTVLEKIIQPFNETSDIDIGIGTTDILLAPIFMMTMCVRGFTLWIINMGLATYLCDAAKKLTKKVLSYNYTIFR
jgi:hypothetical protein